MPRNTRWNVADVPQLVRIHGHNESTVFRCERDYRLYLECMGEAAADVACDVHTFALAARSVAIFCTPREPRAVGRFVQAVGRAFVPRYNRWHRRTGTPWNGRYRAALIEPDSYALVAYRFVETVAGSPADEAQRDVAPQAGPWTGLRRRRDPLVAQLVCPHGALGDLGQSAVERDATYRQLCREPLGPALCAEVELALFHGLALGTERFKDRMASLAGARARLRRPGRPRGPRLAPPPPTGRRALGECQRENSP